ncbi:MAG: AIPR family protein, partial [bacterium]|nr:AIPR family protein [bacterium]
TAFSGNETLIKETQKIIETLEGSRKNLSSLANDIVDRLNNFINSSSKNDSIRFVFATPDKLNEKETSMLKTIKILARERLNINCDVEHISINNIYQRVVVDSPDDKKHIVNITANLVSSGTDVLVGSVKLINLYSFLKDYREATGDLDMIYEKNVRKFLGRGRQVNRGIANTLNNEPERFGLFNNGITIVAENFNQEESDVFKLTEPFIVNGCQTTRTIWEVLYNKFESGGTGLNPEIQSWKDKLKKAIVVVKLVKVGSDGEKMLTDITRYTNSQNAVSKKDFIALEKNFKIWAKEMADQHNVFLEIQRGGWDSQKALQRSNPNIKQFEKYTNAFDLLKVYGAAWLGEPGIAYGKNPPFAPGGNIFKRIVENDDEPFSVNDLYAAYILSVVTSRVKFGRKAEKETRGQTRFLFLFVLIQLLKDCIDAAKLKSSDKDQISKSVIEIFGDPDTEEANQLVQSALNVIDDYLSSNSEDSLYKEPTFKGDLNAFLKWDKLGKGRDYTPKFETLLGANIAYIRRSIGGNESVRNIVVKKLGKN